MVLTFWNNCTNNHVFRNKYSKEKLGFKIYDALKNCDVTKKKDSILKGDKEIFKNLSLCVRLISMLTCGFSTIE